MEGNADGVLCIGMCVARVRSEHRHFRACSQTVEETVCGSYSGQGRTQGEALVVYGCRESQEVCWRQSVQFQGTRPLFLADYTSWWPVARPPPEPEPDVRVLLMCVPLPFAVSIVACAVRGAVVSGDVGHLSAIKLQYGFRFS